MLSSLCTLQLALSAVVGNTVTKAMCPEKELLIPEAKDCLTHYVRALLCLPVQTAPGLSDTKSRSEPRADKRSSFKAWSRSHYGHFCVTHCQESPPTNPGNKQGNVEILEVESEKRRCLGARRGR